VRGLALVLILAGALHGEDNVSRLKACPASPNCVLSTAAADEKHRVAPFPFTGSPAEALARVKAAALSFPRTAVVEEAPGYLKMTFTSALFRFVDDVEFEVDEAAKVVNVRSASRVGYSDLGANRKRVEAIRAKLGG
jgi:uncharacterized protein (DUF1499 family)